MTRSWYALYSHANFADTVSHFLELDSMAARPANAVYRVLLNGSLGADQSAWFAWQAVSCVLMCLSLFWLLRELRLGFADAAAIVVLVLVFPAAASLHFWTPVVHASLAIALGLAGFVLALYGFEAAGRARLVFHALSLALFALSVLLYEVCLPLFAASVLLYALRVPWRRAGGRWLLDLLVVVPIAIFVSGGNEAQDQGLSGSISHAGAIAADLPRMLWGTLLPFGSARALLIVLTVLVYAAAAALALRRPAGDPVRERLRLLFALSAGGLVVVFLGYLIYVPGLDYYLPLQPGIADRINAIAGIGWVIALYAFASMLGSLAAAALRLGRPAAALATAALALALGLSWLAPLAEQSRGYVAASRMSLEVLDVVERAVPDPPPGTVVWTFGQAAEAAPGKPVFANYWNMTAGFQLVNHDRHVRAFVALPETEFNCEPAGMYPYGGIEYAPPPPGSLGRFGSRYGRTWFVDTVRGQFTRIDSRTQCLQLRRAYPRTPALPPEGG